MPVNWEFSQTSGSTFLNLSDNLQLPGVVFSISLMIYTDNLQLYIYLYPPLKPTSIMSIYIHKLLKLPRLDPNLLGLKTLAMSLFILTLFLDKSSLFDNNTAYFRHILYQLLKMNRTKRNQIKFSIILFLYRII